MAEAAGLAVGIVALASLFTNTIECFELIKLGKAFESDFKTTQLKLDACQLRLSRWGASLGLSDVGSPRDGIDSSQGIDIDKAKQRLQHILDLFTAVERISAKFKDRGESTCEPQDQLTTPVLELHNRMQRLSFARRSDKVSFMRRAKWAIYEQKHLRRLLEDVTELIDDLIALFPAQRALQERLCEEEVAVLVPASVSDTDVGGSIAMLRSIAAEQDKLLEMVLQRSTAVSIGSQHVGFYGDQNRGVQVGFNTGTISNSFGM